MKTNWRIVLTYAGAFIAVLLGSGFATGQEIMQYFTAYGIWSLAIAIIVWLLLAFVSIEFVNIGASGELDKPSEVFEYLGGKYLGKFYDYFTIFFVFMTYSVMISGAEATFQQHFNTPEYVGGIIMMLITMVVVFFGMGSIVDIIGNIGPLMIIYAIAVGLVAIFVSYENVSSAIGLVEEYVVNDHMLSAAPNPIMSAFSYVGVQLTLLTTFITSIGQTAKNKMDAKKGMGIGAFVFALACFILSIAILLNIEEVHASQIPLLIIAGNIHPIIATIFAIVIILGIFTTAAPLLWTVVARFSEEKTPRFRAVTVGVAIAGSLIGLFIDFDQIVNIVYGFNGYIGFFLLVIVAFRAFQRKFTTK